VRSGLYFFELVMPGTRIAHRLVVVR